MDQFHMGINLGHDRSVAVVKNGEILVAIEQERLDRVKHSVGFLMQAPHALGQIQVPGECIRYCLDTLGVPLTEMATITANMPGIDHGPAILHGKFSKDISEKIQAVPSHHLAHAYSAYWPSGFEDSLVLVADGSGSSIRSNEGRWCTEATSLYVAQEGKLEPLHLEKVQSHLADLSSLGFVFEYVTRKAGFVTTVGPNIRFAEAGKLMGLAAYGGPQANWIRWFKPVEGAPRVNVSAYDIFLEVAALEKCYDNGEGKAYFRPWLVDLAYKVQKELEDALVHIVDVALEQTGLRHLCMAGGVALNSVANNHILRSCPLDDIFTFPAAGDNGIAAGCALWAYADCEGGSKRLPLRTAALGRTPTEMEVTDAIKGYEDLLVVEQLDQEAMVGTVAATVAQGSIVARFEGGCEFGPRALGHRSIIADPIFPRIKDVINARVKFREAFRPFAPVIPLERANEVFVLDTQSPFMLLVAEIRREFQSVLPSIAHADGTGRVQTCTREDNPFFTALCDTLSKQRGGPPVILNTSFNVAGQPIVETPAEAIATFLRTDIDYLSIGDRWICRRHVPVKTYAAHEATLVDEELPSGLPSDQPSVFPLMKVLDQALFHGVETEHWSNEELIALAAEGGRFKETSRLFPDSGFVAPLQSELGPDAVVIADPIGSSSLVDPTDRLPPVRLNRNQLELLLAARCEPAELGERLRVALGFGPRELNEAFQALQQDIAHFRVTFDKRWLTNAPSHDNPILTPVKQTLAPFSDPGFRLDGSLTALALALRSHDYTESSITKLLGVESLQRIEPTHLHYFNVHHLPETPLADLIRLFLLRGRLPIERVYAILGQEVSSKLIDLDLLQGIDGCICSGVDLYCSGGMVFATDHRYMLLEGDQLDEDPVMYIGMDSHGLVQTAPRTPCNSLLDLCCGSGIQGIVASRYAANVVAVDLNPRAVRFARFNAQLNGLNSYEVRLGSLYEPVAGERFDVVLANPPFVPSPEMGLRFRDGGASGEYLLRQIIAGATKHLTTTGRICIVTDLVDVEFYENKLIDWWGSDPHEALVLKTADRDEILFSVPHCHAPFGQTFEDYNHALDKWVDNFRKTQLQKVNFGYLLLWRMAAGPDSAITLRTIHNPAEPMHLEVAYWYKQQQRWYAPSAAEAHVCLHPDARLQLTHGPDGSNPTYALSVPGNDFYTTYTLTARIYEELCHIAKVSPRRGEAHLAESQWLHQLHRRGLVRLENHAANTKVPTVPITPSNKDDIIEHATKTTPTCLTSYLS